MILLVEDDPLTARSVARALSIGGRVVTVGSGGAALEALKSRGAFAAVWSDLDLGGPTSGMDVLQMAAQTQPSAHLLLVTGSDIEVDVDRGRLDARVRVFGKADIAEALSHVLRILERAVQHPAAATAGVA